MSKKPARKPSAAKKPVAKKPVKPARTPAATKAAAKKPPAKAARPTAKAKAKPAKKPSAAPRVKTPPPLITADELATLREELAEARAELARIASEENVCRRDLEAQVSVAQSVEERTKDELEAMRTELRTALADLEIAHAGEARYESRLLLLAREVGELKEAERRAAHASVDASERLLGLQAENEALRRHLDQLQRGSKSEEPTA
jgi:hypothetical protein